MLERLASWRHSLPAFASTGLGALALGLWLYTVQTADPGAMNSYGLVSVVHPPFFLGLACLVSALAIEILRPRLRPARVVVLTGLLVVYLFGTACAVEPVASLYDSWLHSGFTQYIIDHGHSLNGFDARFSWPGMFALAGTIAGFAGQHTTLGFIRYFPLFIELAYMAPLYSIAHFSGARPRTAWLGVALFYATNWIYQDYFSPQALNYLFFLVVIAVVLALWRPATRHRPRRGRGLTLASRLSGVVDVVRLRRLLGRDTVPVYGPWTTLGAFTLIALIELASSMSHQLTPYAMIVALGALLATRRLGRPELAILGGLFAVGWLNLGASNYWVGHLNAIFGSAGQFSQILASNVTNRLTGNVSHRLVVDARILDVVVLYLFGAVGVVRRAPSSRSLELLTAVPFLLIAAQNYGGEGLLRVVLFGLPFVTVLAASAILPTNEEGAVPLVPLRITRDLGRLGRPLRVSVMALVLLGFASATFVVRGGNDAFESFTTGELAASRFVYDHAPPGQAVWLVTPFMPIEFERVDVNPVKIAAYQGGGAPTRKFDLFTLLANNAHWIILSRSQAAWGTDVGGYPPGWIGPFQTELERDGYTVVARWPTATVLHLGPLSGGG